MNSLADLEKMDLEWVELINDARKIGLSINEIREFLNNNSWYSSASNLSSIKIEK